MSDNSNFIDRMPLSMLVMGSVMLGLAPFYPEPHLIEKLGMLFQGTLSKPLDIFDLFMHGSLPVLLLIRLYRDWRRKQHDHTA